MKSHTTRRTRHGGGATQMETLETRDLLSGSWSGLDVDGDKIAIKLTGPGQLSVVTVDLDDPNSAPASILIDQADSLSSVLSITVTKGKQGNGTADIQRIDTSPANYGLKALLAPKVNLIGDADQVGILLNGYLGKLVLGNVADGVTITAAQDGIVYPAKSSLSLGGVGFNVSITFGSFLGKVAFGSIGGDGNDAATLTAPSLDGLSVKGDCFLDMTLQRSLGKVNIGGQMEGDWTVHGPAGAIKANRTVNSWQIQADSVKSLTYAGDAYQATVTADRLGSLTAKNLRGCNFLLGGVPGDAQLAIDKITISGWASVCQFRADGNMGDIKAGGMVYSQVLAGALPAVSAIGDNPLANDYLNAGSGGTSRINSLTIIGSKNPLTTPGDTPVAYSFCNTAVIASDIKSVKIKNLRIANPDTTPTAYGVAAKTLGLLSFNAPGGKTITYGKGIMPDPSDFVVRLLA